MTKEEKHPILKAIPSNEKITREELSALLNVSDREVRRLVADAKNDTVIIATSNEKGYRRIKPLDQLNQFELEQEYNEIKHSLNELKSRTKSMDKQKRMHIATMKVIEKMIQKKSTVTSDELREKLT